MAKNAKKTNPKKPLAKLPKKARRKQPAAAAAALSEVAGQGVPPTRDAGRNKRKAVKAKPGSKPKKAANRKQVAEVPMRTLPPPPPAALGVSPAVLDRLWSVVMDRRNADPAISHSARLLSRGTAKVAQKFGEEAVECLIEAVAGNRAALVGESADVLYHLIVIWVDAGIRPDEIWAELQRREGVSGIAEKASRARVLPLAFGLATTKIP